MKRWFKLLLFFMQTCVLTITSCKVEKVWGTAEKVSDLNSNSTLSARYPQVAVNDSGNSFAVCSESEGLYNIKANLYTAGQGWGIPEKIEFNDAGSAINPQIVVDSSGNAIAVWEQEVGYSNASIWANRYTSGAGWGVPEIIEYNTVGSDIMPRIAMDPSGNAICIWTHAINQKLYIWANRYKAGSGWGTAQPVDVSAGEYGDNPEIGMDSAGNALAVWEIYEGNFWKIKANRYNAETGWETAVVISMSNGINCLRPDIAVNQSGLAIAVWSEINAVKGDIMSIRFIPGSGWGVPEKAETHTTGICSSPKVGIDGAGNAAAIWELIEDKSSIHLNYYIAGTGWKTSMHADIPNTASSNFPQIAMNHDGYAVAAWQQNGQSESNIVTIRYSPCEGWGSGVIIDNDAYNMMEHPQVAMNASEVSFVVWKQSGSYGFNIWCNILQ
jgi:hypothetical protein